jgi:hypothetical protein
MIDLKRISEGKQQREPRVLIYGGDGVGKTRFAAGAPDPFFLDVNKGSLQYDVKRVIPETWPEVLEWIAAVEKGTIKCKSLVLDSLGDLEHLGNAEFFPGTTIDKWDGGYGRGETFAITKWRELLGALERVWLSGKAIVFIGHMQVKHFDDPTGPGYDRFGVAMREKIAGLIRGWSDYVFFAREEISQQKVGGDIKAVTSGIRWIHTHRSPAFDAKSRGTTLFPERVLLSWDEFAKARAADTERAEALRQEINVMLTEIGDKKLDEMVKEYLRANPGMIVEARNRVAARLEEMCATKPTTENKEKVQ